MTNGMGTLRWPEYMWGSVPPTPQCVTRRIAPSRAGGDSGKLAISSFSGARNTAARIILLALEPPAGVRVRLPGHRRRRRHHLGRPGRDLPLHPDQVDASR